MLNKNFFFRRRIIWLVIMIGFTYLFFNSSIVISQDIPKFNNSISKEEVLELAYKFIKENQGKTSFLTSATIGEPKLIYNQDQKPLRWSIPILKENTQVGFFCTVPFRSPDGALAYWFYGPGDGKNQEKGEGYAPQLYYKTKPKAPIPANEVGVKGTSKVKKVESTLRKKTAILRPTEVEKEKSVDTKKGGEQGTSKGNAKRKAIDAKVGTAKGMIKSGTDFYKKNPQQETKKDPPEVKQSTMQQPVLLNDFMCSDPYDPWNTQTTTFYTNDAEAWKWTQWNTVACTRSYGVKIIFYDNNDNYYWEGNGDLPPGHSSTVFAAGIYIAGYPAENQPGTWHASVFIEGTFFATNYFDILPSGGGEPVLTADFMCSDENDPYNTQTTTFYTNDPIAVKYTEWNTMACTRDWGITITFYDQNGTYYGEGSADAPTGWTDWYFWYGIYIAGWYPENNPGSWHASVTVEGAWKSDNYFDILPAAGGEPVLTADFMCSDQNDPYNTQTTTFYTNDPIAVKYTEWNTMACTRDWGITITFYDQNGTYYGEGSADAPTGWTDWYFWYGIYVAGWYPENNPGSWHASVFLEGNWKADNWFDILPSTTETIAVVSPNGGEFWQVGTSQTITWTSSGTSGNIKIELSRNGGSTWETLFPSTLDDNSESWLVTGPASSNCKVKITDIDGSPSDQSNAPFTIDGGAEWKVPITISGGGTTIIRTFGGDPNATDGYDSGLDVQAAPPGMTYYTYFQISQFPNYLDTDIRRWVSPYDSDIDWTLKIINAVGQTSGLSWNPSDLPPEDTFTLTGVGLNVNMRNQSSVQVNGDATLIIEYRHGAEVTYNFPNQGWYLISLPLYPDNNSLGSLFPTAMSAFAYNPNTMSYYSVITLEPKKGYWLSIPGPTNSTIAGAPLNSYTEHYNTGWHLIGSVLGTTNFTDPNDNPNGSIMSAWGWGPNTSQYFAVYPPGTGVLNEKEGYWLAVAQPCDLTIGSGPMFENAVPANADIASFYKQYGAKPPIPPVVDDPSVDQSITSEDVALRSYPNPFNLETMIEYSILKSGLTKVYIFNTLGQRIRTLLEIEQQAGTHQVVWNGRNDNGDSVNSGIYFCKIFTSNLVETRKLVLIK